PSPPTRAVRAPRSSHPQRRGHDPSSVHPSAELAPTATAESQQNLSRKCSHGADGRNTLALSPAPAAWRYCEAERWPRREGWDHPRGLWGAAATEGWSTGQPWTPNKYGPWGYWFHTKGPSQSFGERLAGAIKREVSPWGDSR